MCVRVCVLAFLTALERGHRARMSPPPPRARRRRRLRRTIPASDCSFTFAFAVFASVFARVVGLFWRALAWGGRAFGDGARCCCRWLGARRWWVRCSRGVVGLAHALMCVLRTCYLFLLRCLRAWRVGSARAGVGRAGVLVTAHAVVAVGWARARWWVRCSRVCGGFGARADVCPADVLSVLASVFARVAGCFGARWRGARGRVGDGARCCCRGWARARWWVRYCTCGVFF